MEINTSYSFFTSKDFFWLISDYLIDPRAGLIAFGLRVYLNYKYWIRKIQQIFDAIGPFSFTRDRYDPISKSFFNDMKLCKKFYFEYLRARLDPFTFLETETIEEKLVNFSDPVVHCPFYGPNHKDTASLSNMSTTEIWSYFMCTGNVSFEKLLVSKKELSSFSELSCLIERRHNYMKEYERGKHYTTKQKLKEGWVWKVKK
jgi:hypothetical protein